MSTVLDSPFFKAFAKTNCFLLGAGALYFVAFGDESSPENGDLKRCERSVKEKCADEMRSLYAEPSEDVKEFTKALSDWNKNLIVLEKLLGENPAQTDDTSGVDEVDAVEIAGYNNSDLMLKKLDQTLYNVVGKVSQLRLMLKTRYINITKKDKTSDVNVLDQDFTSSELLLFRDEDSDADSFLSAEGNVEDQDDIALTDIDQSKQKALEIAGIYRDKALYVKGLELYFNHGVKCRKKRAKMVGCSSDMEFLAKVSCIREASKLAFANKDIQNQFEQNAADLLGFVIRTAGKDHHECQKRWKALVSFCRSPENWKIMEKELNEKGVPFITLYDVVLDFVVMDAFVDLENPPYSVQATVQNTWLPTYIQQTGLETAVWGVLKAKMQMLQEPAGFLMHFYHLSEILTPVLAWGFLGSDEQLTKACNIFKEQLMGYIQDLFNFQSSDYGSVESLAKDISRLAEERYENLKPLLTQPHGNGMV